MDNPVKSVIAGPVVGMVKLLPNVVGEAKEGSNEYCINASPVVPSVLVSSETSVINKLFPVAGEAVKRKYFQSSGAGPVVHVSALAPFTPKETGPTLPAPKIPALTLPVVTGSSSAVSGHTTEAGWAYPLVKNKTIAVNTATSCLPGEKRLPVSLGKEICI